MTLPLLLLALVLHDEQVSESTIVVEGDEVVWTVQVGTPALQKILDFPRDPVDLDEEDLERMKGVISSYLAHCITLNANGINIQAEA